MIMFFTGLFTGAIVSYVVLGYLVISYLNRLTKMTFDQLQEEFERHGRWE